MRPRSAIPARPRGCAAAARAGGRARRVHCEPRDGAALDVQSVHGGGSRGALRHAPEGRGAGAPAARARPRLAEKVRRLRKSETAVQTTKGPASAAPRRSNRRRPTLPGGCPPSTIGPGELNFSVRNGKRCFPAGMTAELSKARAEMRAPSKLHSDSLRVFKSRPRAISTARLNTLLRLHRPPIKVVVSDRPYSL